MEALIDALLEYGPIGILIGLSIVIIPLLPKYIDSLSYLTKGRERKIQEALQSEYINPSSKEILKKELESLHYYRSTGIHADYYLIQSINLLIEESKGEITTKTVRSAIFHLSHTTEGLEVRLDKFSLWAKDFFGLLFWLFVITFIVLLVFGYYYLMEVLKNPSVGSAIDFGVHMIFLIATIIGSSSFLKSRLEVVNTEKIIDFLEKNSESTSLSFKIEDARKSDNMIENHSETNDD